MRSPSKKRTTAKERELTERIRELEEKLAASVPEAEFQTVRSNMQLEINDLKMRLSVAEDQASRAELSKPAADGRLDEDGFEEREADDSSVERRGMESSTEGLATEDSEEPETADPSDEDSEEPEATESRIEPQMIDRLESGCSEARGTKATVSET
jgi:hypothetical protein